MSACIGTPISWPRLERHASGPADATVGLHVAECEACRACLDEILRDVVALPVLAGAAVTAKRARWWWVALPAFAAAALALLLVWPREPKRAGNVALLKGGGEVTLGLVRERAGTIGEDATTFLPGDRWKVVVTCAPGRGTWVDVAVVEAGAAAATADHPLAAAHVACGNRVVVPGAFELTGKVANRVCVRVAADVAPARDLLGGDDTACITVTPESSARGADDR
jgi:membrane protein implicated in regulation of membrane protease activity